MFPIYTRLNYTVELAYYNYTYISWIMQYIWARFFARNDPARNYSRYFLRGHRLRTAGTGCRRLPCDYTQDRFCAGQACAGMATGGISNIEQGMPNDKQRITNIEVGIAAHRRLRSALPSADFQHRADDGYTPRNKLG